MTEEVLTRIEVNCTTGEETIHVLTAEEISQRVIDAEAAAMEQANRDAEALAQANAKASAHAKLAKLGLTAEEIATF
jgi:hypothetical protein